MKKILFLVLLPLLVSAQVLKPVKWTAEIEKTSEAEYQINLIASIDEHWHVYSKDLKAGGIPTKVVFTANESYDLLGDLEEIGEMEEVYFEVFGTDVQYYSNTLRYQQKIKVHTKAPFVIKGEVMFQVCDDSRCLSPDYFEFQLTLNGGEAEILAIGASEWRENKLLPIDLNHPQKGGHREASEDSSLFKLLFLGFLGGLIALLTPCVFPMIPLTISFFTKSEKGKKGTYEALLYGFFIFLIFVLLSVPFHLMEGISANILNQISTSPILNIIFFVVFIFFALSLLGFYEITLPSWLANRSEEASGKGGVLGIFFMALTLAIVSFSCTGPILGTVLAGAINSSGGAMQLTFAMAGFGFSWAIIFGGFALFPNLLNALPKSGNWLNTLKVVLGFVEIAFAFKFLSKADLVSKTFLLKREIFVVIWIVIAVLLLLYVLKLYFLPHDNKANKRIGWGRKLLFSLLFVAITYMGLGLAGKNSLGLLSGIIPPKSVSLYVEEGSHCPPGVTCYDDYEQGLQAAKQENKPLLIDFTGWGCENCRRMEENVWVDPEVAAILEDEVVLVSLYVDDTEELPKEEQGYVKLKNESRHKLKTIGDKWSIFQSENFNNSSQPNYILLTPEEELISHPIQGYKSKEEFLAFLRYGLAD